jgi:hypothetical protein
MLLRMRTWPVYLATCALCIACARHETSGRTAERTGEESGGGGGLQAPTTGGAPSEESPDESVPDADAADGSDVPVTSDSAVTAPSDDAAVAVPESPPEGPLGDELVGHWLGDGQIGSCLALEVWYSFTADGSVMNRLLDDNACSGLRLVDQVEGTYTIDGHTLSLSLDGMGSDRPFEMTGSDAEISRRQERFTIAMAQRPANAEYWPGRVHLDGEAFVGDGARYASERYVRVDDAAGDALFEQQALVTLEIDPPLPLADGAPCRVEITFQLTRLDTALAPDAVVDSFALSFDATVSTGELGWKQVIADELLAVALEERWAAWDAMLVARELDAHGTLFAWTYRQQVFPHLSFDAADPNTLSVGLPNSGRWRKSEEPPRDAPLMP